MWGNWFFVSRRYFRKFRVLFTDFFEEVMGHKMDFSSAILFLIKRPMPSYGLKGYIFMLMLRFRQLLVVFIFCIVFLCNNLRKKLHANKKLERYLNETVDDFAAIANRFPHVILVFCICTCLRYAYIDAVDLLGVYWWFHFNFFCALLSLFLQGSGFSSVRKEYHIIDQIFISIFYVILMYIVYAVIGIQIFIVCYWFIVYY